MGTLTIGLLTRPYGSKNIAFVLRLAKAALEKGHSVKLWLSGDATTVAKKGQHKYQKSFNFEAELKELIERGLEVVNCESCVYIRGINDEEMIDGVQVKTMTWFMENALSSDAALMIGEE
jgi:sulfur relay (sulfurtransferase) complex TusBCD TusD component (DsrE family)